jgi:tRNA U34 2-thiouridine synthase MnmA/TrmU
VLKKQGIDVTWICFKTPFFSAEKARRASQATGIRLIVRSIFPTYLDMLKNPPVGYGQYMNPCMDCHALMFKLAGEIMKTDRFDFLFSGEVLGQRPMSQTYPSLRYVAKQSGMDGYIVRPLCAKRLPESIPEQKGWIDREQLLGLSGRSRKPQMRLAVQYGITTYPAPAGGCLLTDKGYSHRLRDLFDHQTAHTEAELYLLKYGRHLRLNSRVKVIVGRTWKENEAIEKWVDPVRDIVLKTMGYPGPTAVIPGGSDAETLVKKGAAICAGYSKAPKHSHVDVRITGPDGQSVLRVMPVPPGDVRDLLIR